MSSNNLDTEAIHIINNAPEPDAEAAIIKENGAGLAPVKRGRGSSGKNRETAQSQK